MFMDNLDHGIEVNHLRSILFERDTYVISLLYICTFGSWIGFAFAFGQVLQVNFLANGETAKHASLHAAQIAFVGPLLGSLARIYGGRLADRLGGGRVTLGVLGGMILAAGLLVGISSVESRRGHALERTGRLRGRLHRSVHPVRDGQWVCVQTDSVGLRSTQPLAGHQRS